MLKLSNLSIYWNTYNEESLEKTGDILAAFKEFVIVLTALLFTQLGSICQSNDRLIHHRHRKSTIDAETNQWNHTAYSD